MFLFKIIEQINSYWKLIWYKKSILSHFKQIGKNVCINGRVVCLGNNIEIGNNSTLNEGVFLNSIGGIKIGSYCRLSPYVQIHTGGLNLNEHYTERTHHFKMVILENGVWLGAGSIINPGIKIGEGSVVASGSVVTKNIPPFELWGGVPAKKIKELRHS